MLTILVAVDFQPASLKAAACNRNDKPESGSPCAACCQVDAITPAPPAQSSAQSADCGWTF
jgi:hypothetical protein